MKSLWELTRGIASIVNTILGRVDHLEDKSRSQERRLDALENKGSQNFHEMEVEQEKKVQRDENRQEKLSDKELRQELNQQYGVSRWSRHLIDSIIRRRKQK